MENDSTNKVDTVEEVLKIFNNGWNKQVILYGPPGTSKTYSAIEIAAKFLVGKDEGKTLDSHEKCESYLEKNKQYKVIQFHPSYSYEDFVRGIVVKTKEGATPTYEVERKIIESFGEDATEKEPRVLVIDEINRAPLGSVLGELIYGLEYRGKAVSTPYVYKKEDGIEQPLKISEHLYIIGTMNTADRSIGTMDYAVRRRFAFVPVLPNQGVIKDSWNNCDVGDKVYALFNAFMNDEEGIFAKDLLENAELDVKDIKIGHTYFLGKGKKCEMNEENEIAYFQYRIDYQIRPVYQEYIKDGMIKSTGVDRFNKIVNKVLNPQNDNENQNNQ